jgi:hypothetical protein
LVTPEWAGALVSASVLDFFQTTPGSVLGALVSYATTLRLTSPVKAPGHVAPSEAATFIGEHPPIPLIRGTLDNGPKIRTQKLAVIVLATRGLLAAGAGAMSQAVLAEAIAIGSDAVLLGADACSPTQPPGLGNGVTALTGSDDPVMPIPKR